VGGGERFHQDRLHILVPSPGVELLDGDEQALWGASPRCSVVNLYHALSRLELVLDFRWKDLKADGLPKVRMLDLKVAEFIFLALLASQV
jgi:hypothetical protein